MSPPPDEGYQFVPLPNAVHREPRPQARFDKRPPGTARLTLEMTYEVVQPIHIGAGRWRLVGREPVREATRSGTRPMIPGSTMKGLVRARYEAITKSCSPSRAPKGARLGKNLPSRTYSDYTVVIDDGVGKHDVFSKCRPNTGQLCAACALFGAMSLRGRVAVQDLLAPEGTSLELASLPERFSPRPHHLGYYGKPDHARKQLHITKLRGRKFYSGTLPSPRKGGESAEVIPRGTAMSGRIVCTNITAAELGGLLSALGFQISPTPRLHVGAAKAYHFGELAPRQIGVVPGPKPNDLPDRFLDQARAKFVDSPDHYQNGEDWLVSISGEHK